MINWSLMNQKSRRLKIPVKKLSPKVRTKDHNFVVKVDFTEFLVISISILISDVQPDTGVKEDIIDVTENAKNDTNSDSDIAENNEEYDQSVSENENAELETSIDNTTPVKAVQNFHPQLTAIEQLLLKGKYCTKCIL